MLKRESIIYLFSLVSPKVTANVRSQSDYSVDAVVAPWNMC